MSRHTEGPLVVEEFVAGNGTIFMRVLGQDGEEVCAIRTRPGDEEDAARIALTWNSHNTLLEALEKIEGCLDLDAPIDEYDPEHARVIAAAARASARGEGT